LLSLTLDCPAPLKAVRVRVAHETAAFRVEWHCALTLACTGDGDGVKMDGSRTETTSGKDVQGRTGSWLARLWHGVRMLHYGLFVDTRYFYGVGPGQPGIPDYEGAYADPRAVPLPNQNHTVRVPTKDY